MSSPPTGDTRSRIRLARSVCRRRGRTITGVATAQLPSSKSHHNRVLLIWSAEEKRLEGANPFPSRPLYLAFILMDKGKKSKNVSRLSCLEALFFLVCLFVCLLILRRSKMRAGAEGRRRALTGNGTESSALPSFGRGLQIVTCECRSTA